MLKRYKKGIALFLALSIIQEVVFPAISMASTGGPSQPEVESFEPVGTNQMVDLSTGDFTYNIPLMVVPGPNGSYPINLAYHAGIGMEQEASGVGLGWNINPGAITRNMRGLPDDFNGDEIKQTTSMRKDVTIGLGANSAMFMPAENLEELFGFVPSGTSGQGQFRVYYNGYRGVGYSFSGNLVENAQIFNNVSDEGNGLSGAFSLGFSFNNS